MRTEAQKKLISAISTIKELPEEATHVKESLLEKTKSFLTADTNMWPLHDPTFYLGHVPNSIASDVEVGLFPSPLKHQRFLRDLHGDFHLAGIRLTGRIMGEYLREMARRRKEVGI